MNSRNAEILVNRIEPTVLQQRIIKQIDLLVRESLRTKITCYENFIKMRLKYQQSPQTMSSENLKHHESIIMLNETMNDYKELQLLVDKITSRLNHLVYLASLEETR